MRNECEEELRVKKRREQRDVQSRRRGAVAQYQKNPEEFFTKSETVTPFGSAPIRVGFRALCLRFRARPAQNCSKLPETA